MMDDIVLLTAILCFGLSTFAWGYRIGLATVAELEDKRNVETEDE